MSDQFIVSKVPAVHADLEIGYGTVMQQRGAVFTEEQKIELSFIFRSAEEIRDLDITRYTRVRWATDSAAPEYWFDAASTAVDDGNLVLKPNSIDTLLPGRWLIAYSSVTTEHNVLSGIQGGAPNAYYHLNEFEHTTLVNWVDTGAPESGVQEVVAGTNVTVDNADPARPIVSSSGGSGSGQVDSVVGGTDITVDSSDPVNPIVNYTGGGGSVTDHDDLTNVTPDQHHPEIHALATHSDVDETIMPVDLDVLTFDTATGEWGAAQARVSPIGGVAMTYRFSTKLTGAPVAGDIEVDTANQVLAAEIRVNNVSSEGNDLGFIWGTLQEGDYVAFWERTGDNESDYYILTAPPVDNGTWWSMAVSFAYGTGGIENNRPLDVYVINNIRNQLPTGGDPDTVLTKVSATPYDTEWRLPAAGGGATEVTIPQTGHGLTVGQCIRYNGTSWVLANANDANTTALGVVVEVPDANEFKYTITGRYQLGLGLQSDEWYYLSDTVAGGLTTTEPDISQAIVYSEDGDWCNVYAYRPATKGEDTTAGGAIVGEVKAFFGDPIDLPTGWYVCDGLNGTPDLQGRSIFGAGANGVVAGTDAGAMPVAGNTNESGAHDHTITVSSAGSHSHTTGSLVLTQAQLPAHAHQTAVNAAGNTTLTSANSTGKSLSGFGESDYAFAGNNGTPQIGRTSDTGSGSSHNHGSTQFTGAHTHPGVSSIAPNHSHSTPAGTLPPLVGAYWIMYTGA